MPITHTFINPKSDDGDATITRPSDWNASHSLSGTGIVSLAAGDGNSDEFDASLSGWTNVGTCSTRNSNSDAASQLHLVSNAGGSSGVHGVYKNWTPSNGNYIIGLLTDAMLRSNFTQAAIAVGEASAAGKVFDVGVIHDETSGPTQPIKVQQSIWTNVTTFNTSTSKLVPIRPPCYFKITYNSSTNLDFHYSFNGLVWQPINLAVNPGVTIGAVFIAGQASSSHNTDHYWDFIRFY